MNSAPSLRALPSIDRVLQHPSVREAAATHGRSFVTDIVRERIGAMRAVLLGDGGAGDEAYGVEELARRVLHEIEVLLAPSIRPVLNLTGTVLHTNLGRAPLPPEALREMARVAGAVNLEIDLETGRRGDRDSHVEEWLRRLTGAEAATVVNNNAAAVLLTLNSLALRKEVPLSRGELVEIGGAFRMPDIMARAGCRLIEVGTTNRTHPRDYRDAIRPRTALLMKVHPSNYEIRGFSAAVEARELADIAHEHGLPFVHDLGSGTLCDLRAFGLPHEPTVVEAIRDGADVVTFSGDKLLGGPQCGVIVGSAAHIARIKRNPMKRAMRADKLILAALGAVLPLYRDPARVADRLPALRLLARRREDIEAQARRLKPLLESALAGSAGVSTVPCRSQVGSGALPVEGLESAALSLRPRRGGGVRRLAGAFRALPRPVLGRVADGALLFDLRCLGDDEDLLGQLPTWTSGEAHRASVHREGGAEGCRRARPARTAPLPSSRHPSIDFPATERQCVRGSGPLSLGPLRRSADCECSVPRARSAHHPATLAPSKRKSVKDCDYLWDRSASRNVGRG